jgi:hypothetical protein
MTDTVRVATSGTIDRNDICARCELPMMYRVDPGTGSLLAMFCGNARDCPVALVELDVPASAS